MENIEFGNRLSQARKSKNLTQEEVAEKLYVSSKTLSSWETGRTSPDTDAINQLADIYEVSTDYLLGRSEKGQGVMLSEKAVKEKIKEVTTSKMKLLFSI